MRVLRQLYSTSHFLNTPSFRRILRFGSSCHVFAQHESVPRFPYAVTMDTTITTGQLAAQIRTMDVAGESYATGFIDAILTAAQEIRASDLHLQPTEAGLDVRWRLDGVLQSIGTFPPGECTDPIARLKVMAELLTYRTDVPQEGRIRDCPPGVEMRVSTFPTLRGERAVVRFFVNTDHPWYLDDLCLPDEVQKTWEQQLNETSGALLVTGPAGSGKTTTAYASLRQITREFQGGRSIVSLEDPIEIELAGVAQSQVNASAGFTMNSGLRSLLRQDPEVLFIGEIRDADAAAISFQAALTGQLAITTFHAHSAASAISRLHDMGIESYVLRSGIRAILNQRLVRRLCECKQPHPAPTATGWNVDSAWQARGCPQCNGAGYRGRALLVELLLPIREMQRGVISRSDAGEIEQLCVAHGLVTRWERARKAIVNGITSPEEARRVLGFEKC